MSIGAGILNFICGPSPRERYLGPDLVAVTVSQRLAFEARSNS